MLNSATQPSESEATVTATPLTFLGYLKNLPRKQKIRFACLCGFFLVWGITIFINSSKTFELSNSFTHAGPWYRRMALAPIDYCSSTTQTIRYTVLGKPYAVIHIGERTFIQSESKKPAVEVLRKKK